jgi:uncharacterized protein YfaS (alpha-2-macroglobulin family)
MWRRNLVRIAAVIGVLAIAGVSLTMLTSAETPYGRVTGTLTIAENGRPLPNTTVYLWNGEIQHDDDENLRTTTDATGHYTFDRVPVGRYKLYAHGKAHHIKPDVYVTVGDGATATVDVVLKPDDPYINIHQGQRTFTTREAVAMRCHGFSPETRLTVTLYRFSPDAAPRAWHGWLPSAIRMDNEDLDEIDLSKVEALNRVSSTTMPITHRDVEGVFRENLALGILPAGTYLVVAEVGKVRGLGMVAVTDLGLVAKVAAGRAMAYTVNLITGEPEPDTPVEVRDNDQVRARGTSDAHGLAFINLPHDMDGSVEVVGRRGDSMAVATTYLYDSGDHDPLRIFTYTDRPIYRPGHTIYFKSIIRQMVGRRYRLPGVRSAQVRMADPNNDEVYKATLPINGLGDLAGQFTLSDEALPGGYNITLRINERNYYSYFNVAEYRKPEFEVRASPERDRYTRGDTVRFTVDAQYYFGAPVAGANVSYYVTRQPSYYYEEYAAWDSDLPAPPPGNPLDYSTEEDYGEGEIVADGEGTTDDTGRLLVSVDPGQAAKTPFDEDSDWRYTLHATVTDVSQRGEEGSGDVLVTQGSIRLEARTEYLTAPGTPVDVTVHAVDYTGKAQANLSGTIELLRAEWKGDKEILHAESTTPWTTDAQGYANVPVTPAREGDYRVRVVASDPQGRRVSATDWLWVMSSDEADFAYPYQDLQVTADKHVYQPNDTAEIVINTRHAPQQALLTIEGDHVFTQQLITLKNKSTVLKLPVSPDYVPNVEVGICFVKNKQFYSGQAPINISRADRALQVTVTPRKATYRPGDMAEFLVKTTAPDGTPVRSDVSLGVVDEAIYAIQPDTTENITAFFYPRGWNQVQTAFSFPEVYFSGDDKAGATIRTRRFFPDTAFWDPSTLTNRRGEAVFRVKMPDTLTTWRATCRAITADTRAGQAIAKTVVTKPFLVRVEAPRFFTQGDAVQVAVIAHNLTDKPVLADIGLNVTGATLRGKAHGQTLIPAGKSQRSVWTVDAKSLGRIEVRGWAQAKDRKGLEDAMALTLPVVPRALKTVRAWAGETETTETVHIAPPAALLPGSTGLTIRLAPSLAASMLGALEYLARYPYGCTEQTMSCFLPDIEVAMLLKQSGARNAKLEKELPKMVRDGLLRLYRMQHGDGGWGWWEHDDSDPWMTAYVVFGLRRAQEAGYTVNENVLSRASEALTNFANRDNLLESHNWEGVAFLAWQLGESGRTDAAQAVLKRLDTDIATVTENEKGMKYPRYVSGWAWAMMALARKSAGLDATATLEHAWTEVDNGRAGVRHPGWYNFFQLTDDAAMLLLASAILTPDDPRVGGLVRWLIGSRRGEAWYSTRDTAFTLYGLVRYMVHANELHPDADVTVTVNGKVRDRYHVSGADLFAPEHVVTLDAAALGNGPVEVVVEKTGTGRLYYSVQYDAYTTEGLFGASGISGLSVSRVYTKLRRRDPNAPPPAVSTTDYRMGDVIEVTLTVQATQPYAYLMLEDPLPAGCEPRDRGFIEDWEWSDWWTNQISRDELTAFAIRYLAPNERRTITYRVTAMTAGTFLALPPRLYDMYNPDAWASGKATEIRIRE